MSRRALASALLTGLLLVAPAKAADVSLRGVDASGYPTIRLNVTTTKPAAAPPVLRENDRRVTALTAENLGRAKSVVLAIDRSRSMEGPALAHATAAARAFVARKPGPDRISIVTFGARAQKLTSFSSATIDADIALRTIGVDSKVGTALWDAVATGSQLLASEPLPGKVLIVLTDGADTSSQSDLRDAVAAARKAGATVHTIAIASPQFSPVPLQSLARRTGGVYRSASSTAALGSVYAAIAEELRRTWRVEYVTAARPDEKLRLEAHVPGLRPASVEVAIPAGAGAARDSSGGSPGVIPDFLYESALGTQLVGAVVGLIVLLAASLALVPVRGARLRRRLQPHLTPGAAARKGDDDQRFAAFSGLLHATERVFAHWAPWQRLARTIERADLPLRTVELFYLAAGSGFVVGLVAAVAGLPSFVILAAFGAGALLPIGFVSLKAKRRMKAFENQLPDLLITLAASLKAGHSFKQGLQTVVDEGRPPASKELRRVLTEARLGRPIEAALAEVAERLGSKNFEFVITAVTIQGQVGGSLAGLIDMVADTVRQRQQFARKIKALTAMGRAGAYVLMALPFFLAVAITVINPEYMDPLYHTSTGHKLIFIGVGMMIFGSLLLRRVVSFRG
jgi:tight adherence protein B